MTPITAQEWLARLLELAPAPDAEPSLVFEVEVSDCPALHYEVVVTADGFGFRRPSGGAPARLITDLDGARRLHAGTTSAQVLLAEGRLRLRGGAEKLLGAVSALAEMDSARRDLVDRVGPIP